MAATRSGWLLLLLVTGLARLRPLCAANAVFVVASDQLILNVTRLAVGKFKSTVQCGAFCSRHPLCGGFNHWVTGRCEALGLVSLQFSFRIEMVGFHAGVYPVQTCRQLQQRYGAAAESGVQRLFRWPMPVYCDQDLDGGGWTLMVAAVTGGWTAQQVVGRAMDTPSITSDYSILPFGDLVLAFGGGNELNYRLEGQAQTGRRQWGGIWSVAKPDSMFQLSPAIECNVVKRFGDWGFSSKSIGNYLPWFNMMSTGGITVDRLLRTNTAFEEYGTIVSGVGHSSFSHSPWIDPDAKDSGTVLYWIREN